MTDFYYDKENTQAVSLIERRHERLGNMGVMSLALCTDNHAFLATRCCYGNATGTWMGDISRASKVVILISIFIPFIIWTRAVQFRTRDDRSELGPFRKLVAFYRAPITKLVGNALNYVAFTVLYAYMILFEFQPEVQVMEWIVIIWIVTMMLEALRQVGGGYAGPFCFFRNLRFLGRFWYLL